MGKLGGGTPGFPIPGARRQGAGASSWAAPHVTLEDIRGLAHPVLRHRILTNYRAEAEGMSVDKIVDRLLETVTERVKP